MPNKTKLTADQRKDIVAMYAEGRGERVKGEYRKGKYLLREIADKHNIGVSCAYMIAVGER